jgi:hypothetical protein
LQITDTKSCIILAGGETDAGMMAMLEFVKQPLKQNLKLFVNNPSFPLLYF